MATIQYSVHCVSSFDRYNQLELLFLKLFASLQQQIIFHFLIWTFWWAKIKLIVSQKFYWTKRDKYLNCSLFLHRVFLKFRFAIDSGPGIHEKIFCWEAQNDVPPSDPGNSRSNLPLIIDLLQNDCHYYIMNIQ